MATLDAQRRMNDVITGWQVVLRLIVQQLLIDMLFLLSRGRWLVSQHIGLHPFSTSNRGKGPRGALGSIGME